MHKGTFAGSGGVEVKGAGVNVLVLDDGVDIRNEDLIDNVDVTMVRNFDFARDNTASSEFGKFRDSDANAMLAKDDPTPVTTKNGATVNVEASHGTNVAGIINASQNGKGTMGIAPLAKLGGAGFIGLTFATAEEAYGGGSWANRADIINASFGGNPATPPSYAGDGSDSVALRAMVPSATNDAPQTAVNPGLRGGKGGLFIKATGNEFGGIGGRECDAAGSKPFANKVGCETSANDTETLEPMVVNVAAINAAGVKSSYSNASSLNWVSGGGGEFGGNGTYGEGKGDDGTDGPVMFSTDLRSLTRGYSRSNAGTDFLKGLTKSASNVSENANGDYSYMNGTSAATPSVAGVVALIMSANPSLGWRDVREILATTSRKMDGTYPTRVGSGKLFDLVNRQFTADDATAANSLVNGATTALLDYGWQTTGGTSLSNATGRVSFEYSNWYGFGLADAQKAVEAAKAYGTTNSSLLRSTLIPADNGGVAFAKINDASGAAIASFPAFSYGKVTKLGEFTSTGVSIEQVQLRITGGMAANTQFCVGSVGFAVKAPDGKVSILSTPLNTFYSNGNQAENAKQASNYTLGSYGFFGLTPAAGGKFEVYAISTRPTTGATDKSRCGSVGTEAVGFDNVPANLVVEYRVLPRVLQRKDGSVAGVK